MERRELDRWLLGSGHQRRRTQDSPILPDVWYAYALPPRALDDQPPTEEPLVAGMRKPPARPRGSERPPDEVDLLLRPHAESTAGELARALGRRLDRRREATGLAFNDAYVVCRLTFRELLSAALPLTTYWQRELWPGHRGTLDELVGERTREIAEHYERGTRVQGGRAVQRNEIPGELIWLIGLVGRIAWTRRPDQRDRRPTARQVVAEALEAFSGVALGAQDEPPALWAISRNRLVHTSVYRSRIACKADAATRLFRLSCRDIRWAVIDSGVDARHPAFAQRQGDGRLDVDGLDPTQSARSRVLQTWDFADIRNVLSELALEDEPAAVESPLDDPGEQAVRQTEGRLRSGRLVDWDAISPRLEIRHDAGYTPPRDEHGTHVAGVLAADWQSQDQPTPGEHDIQGMCPDIRIYDLRAFNAQGESDEFQVLSALQFVRHLNAHADIPAVHGANLSFSLRQEVDKYAAGATPVCVEATRLVGSGVVVVAAAGNDGRAGYVVNGQTVDGYRTVSITDPGNCEAVITVGATHRDRPHEYGVSYFSSRGPTGDGRAKPDLVAPGEKIWSAVPEVGLKCKDGTSQAAPHVSGACALLMARHPELIGQPQRVKEVLVQTCTDLGRIPSFQGAGMVDVLRAIQAV
jgi:serine protease AprX